ncbi:alpha/beta hydrolase [Saccharothrix sp. MB29]|nr:alpha/beta hydrolase [Saccharothrix sp. MB29]
MPTAVPAGAMEEDMSILGRPRVAAVLSRAMQVLVTATASRVAKRTAAVFPEFPGRTTTITVPTSVAPAPSSSTTPRTRRDRRPCTSIHGGGFAMPGVRGWTTRCAGTCRRGRCRGRQRRLRRRAAAPVPAPPHQAYAVVRWVAEHGAEHGWDGGRLTVGGQSAGGSLAAAVARPALERGGPAIAAQVLHYPALDLSTPGRDKTSTIAKPMLRPWMGEVFDGAYLPDRAARADRLVSPAGAADTADLTGIAPALVITPAHDRLHAEGARYAERLRGVGALLEHRDVPDADHGYDVGRAEPARESYALIARHVARATRG